MSNTPVKWTSAGLTPAGNALQAELLNTGDGITFTRAAAADADGTERLALTLQSPRTAEGPKCRVPVLLSNIGVTEAFTMTELRFYVKRVADGTPTGDEVLYATATDETGDAIPTASSAPGFTIDWAFVFQFGNASDVTVTLDPAGLVSWGQVGEPNGVAPLDENGKVPSDNLSALGGSLLTITFDEALEGLPYTLSGGEESYAGTVPESLTAVHSLLAVDTDYTLTVTNAAAEKTYTRTVHTDDWYTALEVAIAPFAATITVTCPAGSSVTCANGDTTLTQTAASGTAVFTVGNAGTWTVTATLDGESASGEVVISADGESKSITLQYVHIYGVLWDGTSTTALSRTDDAAGFSDPVPAVSGGSGNSPFDTLLPWSGMVRSTDPQAGELVAIPKYWYKWTKSGSTIKLQIADGPAEGFLVSPAHCDRGDGHGERDVVYVGRYHCHTSNWKSQSGGQPKADITRSSARSSIHNLGSNIWQIGRAHV